MNLNKATQDKLIEIIRRAGQEVVMPNFRQLNAADVEEKSSFSDLVTIADKASEAFITEEIHSHFPDWKSSVKKPLLKILLRPIKSAVPTLASLSIQLTAHGIMHMA